MVPLKATSDGVQVPVKVVPRSSRARIAGILGDRLKVCVTAAPEKGKANREVEQALAAFFEVPASNVRVVSGRSNPQKTVLIGGVSASHVEEKLEGTA